MKILSKLILFVCLLSGALNLAAQVPILNSYPSAPAVLFLDFDGHLMEGTSWNSFGPISCGPSNLNADQITEVFNRVAEDYRPFNINITTDSTKYWSAPAKQRIRVVLTITSDWYGRAGGVAYPYSFTWGDNTPCFVFTALLGYNVKMISEVASHEAGHTLGLNHQASYNAGCAKLNEYNYGQGEGEIGWAPIMGVAYYKNFSLWHTGPNPYDCSSTQSDLDIIAGPDNGFGFRPDDHSNDVHSATPLSITDGIFKASGVISKSDDKDVFKFTVDTRSRLQLDAIPFNVGSGNAGSDLDMLVQLIDTSEHILGSYNPGTKLSSFVDTTLNAGSYYILIDGTANQYASKYGSLGSYSVQGQLTAMAPLPLHQLLLKGTIENGQHVLSWVIEADEKLSRQVLEVSTNSRDFTPLTEPALAVRRYNTSSANDGVLQYRLHVFFDNGRQYYSNIVPLKNNNSSSAKPRLLNNIISNNQLMVSSPATCNYSISNYNGKLIAKGQLGQGNITLQLPVITNGLYIIRFERNGEQHVEKFMKE
ncbi:MAG: T9SS type A sorting domain-containing protein [Flavisolibacter sp.]|nr:T9SS type A sorting domain-containing protein [Flavisolibacter sp.]